MDDDFTELQFAWMRQVIADHELPATCSKLAIALTFYFNRKTGEAWPSLPTLAKDMGVTKNTARAAMTALVIRGHLSLVRGGGDSSNRYKMIYRGKAEEAEPIQNSGPVKKFGRVQNDDLTRSKNIDLPRPENWTGGVKEIGPEPLEYNPLNEPSEEPTELRAPLRENPALLPRLEIGPKGSPRKKQKHSRGGDEHSVREILEGVLSTDTASELIAHRKALKAPLTVGAAKGLVQKFEEYGDPQSAASEMMANGWRGFRPDWMANRTQAKGGSGRPDFIAMAVAEIGDRHGR